MHVDFGVKSQRFALIRIAFKTGIATIRYDPYVFRTQIQRFTSSRIGFGPNSQRIATIRIDSHGFRIEIATIGINLEPKP